MLCKTENCKKVKEKDWLQPLTKIHPVPQPVLPTPTSPSPEDVAMQEASTDSQTYLSRAKLYQYCHMEVEID